MASDDVLLNISARYLDQNKGENDVNSCEKCFKMKDDLKVILNELKSAQLIVKILQDEIKTKPRDSVNAVNLSNCVDSKSVLMDVLLRGRANNSRLSYNIVLLNGKGRNEIEI
jgi:hypothetical protein